MTDFSDAGNVEISDTETLFLAAEILRKACDEAALICSQVAADIEFSLSFVPTVEGNARRKARRVARHARRMSDQLVAARESAKKIPHEFNRVYEAELTQIRNKGRKRFDIAKGA
jgi:hypothetical protein